MNPTVTTHVAFGPIFILLLLVVVPLLVFFIRLCIKQPKVAATVALVPLLLIISVFLYRASSHVRLAPATKVVQYLPNSGVRQIKPYFNQSPIINNSSANQAPIWSEGIEDQFEANVYPSGISALLALAPRVAKQIPYVMGELGPPETIVIYTGSLDVDIVEQFRDALSKLKPESKCRIEIGNVALEPNEVGIRFTLIYRNNSPVQYTYQEVPYPYPSGMSLGGEGSNATIQASISSGPRNMTERINYINKSWAEDFSTFINRHPDKQYVVAKSNETSIAPEEADRQAMQNACYQVDQLAPNLHNISSKDILDSGVVVDKFVQSFNGTAGKIWRQAVLLDVSPPKLDHLAAVISGAAHARSTTLARMVFSIIGLFVLITIVYVFLNAATKGYYSWSLRIIGVILAAVFLMIILKIS